MSSRIVQFNALQELCAPHGPPPRAATVRRWAERQGIRYKYDRHGGIWTTLDALNAALGLVEPLKHEVREEDNI
ncbi:hypothetical protein MOQ14_17265 [Stenotrophomonas maltophilia]|uniref:hypothetical protein n=1 Tax=Stenotrophomonas TaxID=40323 RepID=UPI0015DD7CD0|nr:MULTISPECIES: hypothetical protein [Stenotrophomonas]MBA0371181.1 hypothetical protein [Stenotrophomonas maltophilia]MBH1558513.1 hypothetical protein [Stenotrophomonas maltophilia]MCI1140333.1 hypothetical protein [Stenotrophomonas maltophilia]HDX0800928.1 hypothetical protein [Stenotrophomonas maltophilia]HDX0814909.1 hypothetical protein [Stenotrophomonas maltophilia]